MNGRADSDEQQARRQRLDQWLWHARVFKSRSLAARRCREGKVRVNGVRGTKASVSLAPGDVLTLPRAGRVRVFRVVALAKRRGPAAEARLLYEDLSPPAPERGQAPANAAERAQGGGRPTKKERRDTDRLKGSF